MADVNVKSVEPRGEMFKVRATVDGVDVVFDRVRDDKDLDAQVLAMEAAKSKTITLGPRTVVPPVVKQPDPPTQEEIDRAAFVVLVREYRNLSAEVAAGVGKTTQADVDAKVVEIKTAYKDEYAPMLVGVF